MLEGPPPPQKLTYTRARMPRLVGMMSNSFLVRKVPLSLFLALSLSLSLSLRGVNA